MNIVGAKPYAGAARKRKEQLSPPDLWLILICFYSCPCVWLCPLSISWTAQPFFYQTWYGGVLLWGDVSCRKSGSPSSIQGHSEGLYNLNIWLFILYLLNCWFVMTIFTISSKLLVSLQPNLLWWYSIISWSVLWEIGLLCSRSRSQRRVRMLVNVCLDDIFWTTEQFVTKPGMLMQYYKLKYHAEKLVYCVQCQGHNKGLYNQNMTISVVSSKLLVDLQPNSVW